VEAKVVNINLVAIVVVVLIATPLTVAVKRVLVSKSMIAT